MHPGYRLLGENVAFARACTDAGLSFIGPVAEGDHDDRQQTGAPEWLYTLCAIVVVLYALSVLYGIGAEAPPRGPRLSDFAIPAMWLSLAVTVAFVQVWRQTLLGWLLLLTGFAALAALGLVIFCSWYKDGVFDAWPLIIPAPLVAICGALIWHRPTRDR